MLGLSEAITAFTLDSPYFDPSRGPEFMHYEVHILKGAICKNCWKVTLAAYKNNKYKPKQHR